MAYCNEHGLPHSNFLEWAPEDRAKCLAYEIEKSLRCTMCGTAQWEWDENRFAYEATVEVCQGCYRREMTSKEMDSSAPGQSVQLSPTRGAQAEARRARAAAFGKRRD